MINKEFVNYIPKYNINPGKFFSSLNNIFRQDVSYENKCEIFYDKLKELSKSKGLGDNISVHTVYEENIPEKIFTIHIEQSLSKKEKYVLLEDILSTMCVFAKQSMLWDFFKDSYILIK